ncbi:MAG: Omp28-related outer membrane protein [Crocinitomicaceae bacterium]|nr:Omp28-related outer membrane protein [Crocinitomicaceae bacterium]
MKLSLFTCLLTVSFIGNAQFFENFEGVITPALPVGWTQITNATDGGYITSSDYTSQNFIFPVHTRYIGTNDELCNCDKSNEQLISPAFTLPNTGLHIVEFEYVLGTYYGETAEVGISTDGGATSTQVAVLEPSNASGAHLWMFRGWDISAYAGQTVNIVWTYHDNSDWGSGLMIDNIEVREVASVDMKMVSVPADTLVVMGNYPITGVIQNLGADTITAVDITWNDGTGNNTETFNVNLVYGEEYNFTHSTLLNSIAGANYSVAISVSAVGDTIQNNDTLIYNVAVFSQIVPKVVVGEVKTGEWCGWGPRAHVAMAEMSLSNPDNFISIAIHNGDAMAFSSYDAGSPPWPNFSGYPYGAVDRVIGGDGSTLSTMHAQRISHVPPAAVNVVSSINGIGTVITVDVSADMVANISGDYRLAVVLVQDSVLGNGQSNYYDGGGAGALQFPNAGAMANFDVTLAGSTITPYYHDHVARALGEDEFNGAPGSLPASLFDGNTYNYSYNFNIDSTWNLNKMSVVGMLIDASTGEILNAGQHQVMGSLSIAETVFLESTLTLLPNPTSGNAQIMFDLNRATEVKVAVYNVYGEQVYLSPLTFLMEGTYTSNIDLSMESDGVYFVQVEAASEVLRTKLNLIK